MNTNPTTRFSSRVKDYILYRPGYPLEIIDFLKNKYRLTPQSVIADIGSGTGKSAEMFLQNGNKVYGVEPNEDMRLAAENLFHGNTNFISINARSEETGLPDKCIDFIVAGQAFHWFDLTKTKKEFQRILNPGGKVALIWNEREPNQTGFMGDYDAFLYKYSTDYKEIDHRNINETKIATFFSPGIFDEEKFENQQIFDFEGLKGRYDSASYAIPATDPRYKEAIEVLIELFEKYEEDGKVAMKYMTKVFCGDFGR
jgi:SAM-dependent methyltransferase